MLVVWFAYGIALVSTALLARHVARRYPTAPRRLPAHIGIDGRASRYSLPRAFLWVPPAVLAGIVVVLTAALIVDPPQPAKQLTVALAFLIVAEAAWLLSWIVDRQIELARKMTYRIAPARLLRALLPLLATVAVTLATAPR